MSELQVNRSVQASWIRWFCSDFPSWPELFSRSRKSMDKLCENPPPPPPPSSGPSPNNLGFQSLRAKTLCMCVLRYWGVGGQDKGEWGGLSRTCLKPCFLWQKKHTGTFFHRKRVGMPNCSGFWATWKISTKLSHRAGLHRALQLAWRFAICKTSQSQNSFNCLHSFFHIEKANRSVQKWEISHPVTTPGLCCKESMCTTT